jgi:hypothetical protein
MFIRLLPFPRQAVRARFEAAGAEMTTRLAGLEEAPGTWGRVEEDVAAVRESLREEGARERSSAGTPLDRLGQAEVGLWALDNC